MFHLKQGTIIAVENLFQIISDNILFFEKIIAQEENKRLEVIQKALPLSIETRIVIENSVNKGLLPYIQYLKDRLKENKKALTLIHEEQNVMN